MLSNLINEWLKNAKFGNENCLQLNRELVVILLNWSKIILI